MNLPGILLSKAHHLGINITLNSIWVVGSDADKNIIFQNSAVSQESFFDGDKVNQKALAEALKTATVGYPGIIPPATVCFPERLAYSREHTLPRVPLAEVAEAISWQLPSIFPLEQKDIYTDWKLLSQTASELKVVVVAVGKTLIDGMQAACLDAGIQPFSFEPSASTLARALDDPLKTHIILEIDGFGTSASWIENSVASLTTTATFTSSDQIEQIIQNIGNSLKNLMAHAAAAEVKPEPPPVYLSGEKAAPKLAEMIAAGSGFTVSLLPLTVNSPGLHVPYIASLSAHLPPESEKSINLLPPNLQLRYKLQREIKEAKAVMKIGFFGGLIAIAAAAALLMTGIVMKKTLAAQLTRTVIPPQTNTSFNLPATAGKAVMISQLAPQKYMPTDALELLDQSGVFHSTVKKLTYDAAVKQIMLTVEKSDRESLYTLKENLEKTGKFAAISVPLSVFSSDNATETTLTLTLK